MSCPAVVLILLMLLLNKKKGEKFMPLMTLANEAATGTAISADAWKSVLTAMTSQISVTTVVGVLASVVGSAIALVFMWWGVRKLARTLMAAFRSGKLRF